MKVIIPASGIGSRFKSEGYDTFKALLPVNNMCVMDYVLSSFSNDDEFFIISSPVTYDEMDAYIKTKDLNIKHFLYKGPKSGPVGTVVGAVELSNYIEDNDQVIISYCDYGMVWNYLEFKEFINKTNCDGAIPCYTGYHPHLEDENNVYAACKADLDLTIYTVKEKYKSKNRHKEYWSAGLYYFKEFKTALTAFKTMINQNDHLNGEYYVSLAYNHIKGNFKVYPKISKFYQFGTPKDFEYAKSKINSEINNEECKIKNTVILAAGKGERFLNLSFQQPKPFLPVNGRSIIDNIAKTFSKVDTHFRYVGSKAHELFWRGYDVVFVEPNKIGAAYSYKQSCSDLIGETLILPCDVIAKHITKEFLDLREKSDFIVFTTKPSEFANNNPNSFAWVIGEENKIKDITIKEKIYHDSEVLIGSFWCKSNEVLLKYIDKVFEENFKVNGEFYLDNVFKFLIRDGYNISYVTLDNYFSLGTPSEYYENKYWLEAKC